MANGRKFDWQRDVLVAKMTEPRRKSLLYLALTAKANGAHACVGALRAALDLGHTREAELAHRRWAVEAGWLVPVAYYGRATVYDLATPETFERNEPRASALNRFRQEYGREYGGTWPTEAISSPIQGATEAISSPTEAKAHPTEALSWETEALSWATEAASSPEQGREQGREQSDEQSDEQSKLEELMAMAPSFEDEDESPPPAVELPSWRRRTRTPRTTDADGYVPKWAR